MQRATGTLLEPEEVVRAIQYPMAKAREWNTSTCMACVSQQFVQTQYSQGAQTVISQEPKSIAALLMLAVGCLLSGHTPVNENGICFLPVQWLVPADCGHSILSVVITA